MSEQIQAYHIKNLIREDGMGKVYLARHLSSDTLVSIRLLNPALVNETVYRNLPEMNTALVGLNHPGIARFYTNIRQEEHLYLVAEYIPAPTLGQYLSTFSRPLPEEKIWDIFSQLTDIFQYAHARGIHHLAIHPENILITPAEEVKVLDFGTASLWVDPSTKALPGTPDLFNVQYISPEHVQGKDLDERSDIYSLGLLLFELLTRQCAYPQVLSVTEITNKILHHSLPPVKLYTRAFAHSYTMQGIVDKATAKNPAYRFQDFIEMKESLLEEKDERETVTIQELMQEVNNRSLLSASGKVSVIKLARRKTRIRRISQSLVVMGLMAGAIALGMNIRNSVSGNPSISLNEDTGPDEESATTDTADTQLPEQIKAPADAQLPSSAVAAQAARQEATVPGPGNTASTGTKPQHKTPQPAVAHAGFSLETSPANSFSQVQLQARLEGFYEALRSKDVSQAAGYYAPTLTHFFSEKNVNEKKLRKLLLTAWKRTPEDKHEILWDTFRYSQDAAGNYTLEFYMNYVYRRANKNWRKRKIFTQIKMDQNLQIYAMTGD
jgi:serine/threonine protein kinase